jgi:oligopeptidase B
VRQKANILKTNQIEADKKEEIVLDQLEVPFVPNQLQRSTLVNKFKISDNQTLVAFILDIGNTERLTGGFKNMTTGKILPIRLDNIGDIVFGEDHVVFYSETDSQNRPYKVMKLDVDSGESECIFVDDDPTHYIDIGTTKDKRYIVIASNTKEDSEIWVIERSKESQQPLPRKLLQR